MQKIKFCVSSQEGYIMLFEDSQIEEAINVLNDNVISGKTTIDEVEDILEKNGIKYDYDFNAELREVYILG